MKRVDLQGKWALATGASSGLGILLGFPGDEVGVELGDAMGWKHGDAIFVALAGAHDALIVLKVDVLHAQGEALVDAQTAAVEEQLKILPYQNGRTSSACQ